MDLLFNPKKQKGFLLSIEDKDSMEWVEQIRKHSDKFFKEIKEYFPRAIILAPTRELVNQINNNIKNYSKYKKFF